MGNDAWPAFPYEEWAPTKKTLQMCVQMVGKTKLALASPQPEWLHASLQLDACGFTTGPMPVGVRVLTVRIDVFSNVICLALSDGRERRVALGPDRCVADIWAEYSRSLAELNVEADIWTKPQELADVTPFDENTHDCLIVPEQAQRFHRLLCSLHGVFEEFRSQFFGRSGVQFWWGAFDYAVLLFTGKHEVPPDNKGYIMRYDLDAEHMNAGFWPGDDAAPQAKFYAYLVPRPDGCETAAIEPEHAGWVEAMGEWLMSYDSVRENADPGKAILNFLNSVYRVAVTQGRWDAEAFRYTKPVPSTR
ncbi:MAG: hypothetical protein HGA78_06645 [Nitrospirales bacterium]|nr:hypothetical protein [Nitrospirales bacterium]